MKTALLALSYAAMLVMGYGVCLLVEVSRAQDAAKPAELTTALGVTVPCPERFTEGAHGTWVCRDLQIPGAIVKTWKLPCRYPCDEATR